jgi:hypothetical protein
MRPGFTAQEPATIARYLAREWRWIMEYAWMQKTGSPPKSFEDYDPLSLSVLLSGELAKAVEHKQPAERTRKTPGRWGPPTLSGKSKADYATPITTGDPVADEWERQIAEGKLPDW